MPLVLTPHPVPCRACGTILQATYAEQNGYCCPTCGEMVCYTCGCGDVAACTVTETTADGTRSQTYACGWALEGALPGICSFCFSRVTYEHFMEATGRPADDPHYLSLGRDTRAVKGLAYGL